MPTRKIIFMHKINLMKSATSAAIYRGVCKPLLRAILGTIRDKFSLQHQEASRHTLHGRQGRGESWSQFALVPGLLVSPPLPPPPPPPPRLSGDAAAQAALYVQ